MIAAIEQEHGGREWSREWIVEAILAWREQTGRWPDASVWQEPARNHPGADAVEREFGCFAGAIAAARAMGVSFTKTSRVDVPTEPLARAVDAWIAEEPFDPHGEQNGAGHGRTRTMFAELVGMDPSRLARILRPRRHVTRRVADRILDTADLAYLWHVDPDLRAVLEADAGRS